MNLDVAGLGLNFDQLVSSHNDIIFISGSCIEGFGNPKSDFDFYYETGFLKNLQASCLLVQDDYYIDFETLSRQGMFELGKRINILTNNSKRKSRI